MQKRSLTLSNLTDKLRALEEDFYNRITTQQQSLPQSVNHHSQGDDQLDQILGTAMHLKEIGYEINDEIGVHVRLLDEIDEREDEIFSKHRVNERLLRDWKLSKSGPVLMLWGLVCVLFLILVYLILW